MHVERLSWKALDRVGCLATGQSPNAPPSRGDRPDRLRTNPLRHHLQGEPDVADLAVILGIVRPDEVVVARCQEQDILPDHVGVEVLLVQLVGEFKRGHRLVHGKDVHQMTDVPRFHATLPDLPCRQPVGELPEVIVKELEDRGGGRARDFPVVERMPRRDHPFHPRLEGRRPEGEIAAHGESDQRDVLQPEMIQDSSHGLLPEVVERQAGLSPSRTVSRPVEADHKV